MRYSLYPNPSTFDQTHQELFNMALTSPPLLPSWPSSSSWDLSSAAHASIYCVMAGWAGLMRSLTLPVPHCATVKSSVATSLHRASKSYPLPATSTPSTMGCANWPHEVVNHLLAGSTAKDALDWPLHWLAMQMDLLATYTAHPALDLRGISQLLKAY